MCLPELHCLLARMYERRIFIPAESDALRLEEHEQFNRKIVASAPVGICILRTADGVNILVTNWRIPISICLRMRTANG